MIALEAPPPSNLPELPDRADASALDEAELVRLYATHYEPLVRLAAVLLDDRGTCEDVVQDAFARYWTLRRRPDGARVGAYLRSMVLNRARSVLRRRQVLARLPLRAEEPAGGPDDAAITGLEVDGLVRSLRALPRRQMEVLTLRFWLDQSSSEIADTLGISIGSVKTHARRGLAALGDATGVTPLEEDS